MQHPDEHMLAFFALDAPLSQAEREAMEAHLKDCHTCRSQLEELRQINRHVAEQCQSPDLEERLTSEALVTTPHALRRRPDAPPIRIEQKPANLAAGTVRLVLRHPVAAGSMGVVLAFLGFTLIQGVRGGREGSERPVLARANALGTALEVYGETSGKLWEIPIAASNVSESVRDQYGELYTRLADLDGDGKVEVITSAPFPEADAVRCNVLRVFNQDGTLRFASSLGGPQSFNGSQYSGQFGLNTVVITGSPGTSQRDIMVGANNDRSPSAVVRVDHSGRILGEYWHFGWLSYPAKVFLKDEARELILLHGINDVEYRTAASRPVLAALDPAKIVGRCESPETPGFGLPPSTAEVYYVRLGPVNPTLFAPGVEVWGGGFDSWVRAAEDSAFTLRRCFNSPLAFPLVFYTFDSSLRVRSVWMIDDGRLAIAKNYLRKKTPAGVDEFLDDLKGKVEYWDGRQWKKEPTRILSASTPTP